MSPIAMTLLLLAGWGIFAYSARRRWKLMKIGPGEQSDRFDQPRKRLAAVWNFAIKQLRMRRYPIAGIAHMFIFSGFIVLLLRSLILWGRGYDESFDLWVFGTDRWPGRVYSFFKDLFVVLVIVGTLVFFYYRLVARLSRMTLSVEGLIILGIILVMMFADVLYDAGGLASAGEIKLRWYEPAGSVVAPLLAGASDNTLRFLQHLGFWTHSALVLLFLNLLPYSKHFHIITAVPNVYTQSLKPARLPPVTDIDGKVERGETLGVKRIDQFSWKAILDFYTCTECGRCSDYCPATKTGKKLSPKHFTIDLRNFLYEHESALTAPKRNGAGATIDESVPQPAPLDAKGQGSGSEPNASDVESEPRPSGSGLGAANGGHSIDLVNGVIDPEVLWACTSCRACEVECPVFISYVDKIVDMRRYLVQERGEFPAQLQTAFRSMESAMNPWGFPAEDRGKWAEDLGVKTLADHPEAEIIFWVGCMPSFDDRAKRVTRATAQLMQKAGVDFAILAQEEQCTGDPARRAGNEYLYQMFAAANVQTLNRYGAEKKKIVTTCPHCFNTLLNEYPDFGGKYEVVHHSTFLSELVRQGKLKPTNAVSKRVVFHDSCYLGRYNDVYDDPRETLRSIPGLTVLEPKETRDRGMCCGAGGAQMFKEEEPGDQRVNKLRTAQLLETNPDAVSSACPFCMRMLTDGLADHGKENIPQLDIAEMLWESIEKENPP
jgi:Fe-S oxidoreductase